MDARGQLSRGHDQGLIPLIAIADVHELDQANDHTSASKPFDQIEHGMVVNAALYHRVDLDGGETDGAGGLDSLQHLRHPAEAAAHRGEDLGIETVETHRDSGETRGLQFGRVFGEQDAVGGQSDIVDTFDGAEITDQIGEVGSKQRFTAGDPDFA